jgi:methyltransferase
VDLMSAPTSLHLYLLLLAAVGLGRLLEMRLSRRHQRALRAALPDAAPAPEPAFAAMVALHTGVLLAAAVETVLLRRPFHAALGVPALLAFALANGLRWWVIATLGQHWNVRVVSSMQLGVVTSGPYRWVRHPNYVAVFVELAALPLIHGAWLTALVGGALHLLILRRRIALEESVLLADAGYRAAMGDKPRFLPVTVSPRGRAWPMS